MEITYIKFLHDGDSFKDLYLEFNPSPGEQLLDTIKKDFKTLEGIANQVYPDLQFMKTTSDKYTQDSIEIGFQYRPRPATLHERIDSFNLFARVTYGISALAQKQPKGVLHFTMVDNEERILQVYDRVLAADVTVEKREKPVQRRITLLREGKRGEELLQRLQALAEE